MARYVILIALSISIVLSTAAAQQVKLRQHGTALAPRRMLLETNTPQSAQWSMCPQPGSSHCYPNSWGCMVPGCGSTTCCHPAPVPPPYASGKCWDIHSGRYVDNGVVLACWRGGSRMCQNGQWRVIYGQCDGEEYYNPAIGQNEILVGSTAPPAPSP